MSATAGLFGLGSLFADDDGSPVLADEITANVNDLGAKLADRYDFAQRSTTGVALLMVSDWGKMQAVRDRIDNAWKLPPTIDDMLPPLRLAANQWFANALVPSVYPDLIWVTPQPQGSGSPNWTSCEFSVGEGGTIIDHPWRDLPASMQVKITLGFIGTREVKTGLFATDGFRHSPSATIGNLLFNSPDARSPGLGLNRCASSTRVYSTGACCTPTTHPSAATCRSEPRAVAAARPRQSRPWVTCRSSSRRCSSRPPG